MLGIALEGGGAKGAYQAGAYIALKKKHIKPSIIAGTCLLYTSPSPRDRG